MSEPNGYTPGSNATPTTNGNKTLQSFTGPVAHGKQTTVTLYNRAQLIASGMLPPLENLINISFDSQPDRFTTNKRLRYDGQLLMELGDAPDTFVYIMTDAEGSGDVIATAYASRYEGVAEWPEGPGVERTWARLGLVEQGTEAWELHMMAVSPGYQRQGLADYLMKLVDAEIVRREVSAGGTGKRLMLYISTFKKANMPFYLRKGFREVYSVDWPSGHFGSPMGFSVVHMDREIKV